MPNYSAHSSLGVSSHNRDIWMRKQLLRLTALLGSFTAGIVCTVGWHHYRDRAAAPMFVRADLEGDRGLRIPAGIEMAYDKRSSDGVHVLRLDLYMDSLTYNSKMAPMPRSGDLQTWVD